MSREYLRTRDTKPYDPPMSEREELQNILWSIGTAIPGSSIEDSKHPLYVEMSHLRDMVQWQAEKIAQEPAFSRGEMPEEALDGFREYLRWRDRRDMGVLNYSVPGIPGQEAAR